MTNFLKLFIFFIFSEFYCLGQSSQVSDGGGMLLLLSLDENDTEDFERGEYRGTHPLGETITRLMNDFEKNYIYYIETDGAYSSKEKKIEKPEIYHATNRVLKAYKKELRKKTITEDKARNELYIILTNVVKLKNYKTANLELLLAEIKNIDELKYKLMNLKFID